MKILKQFSNSEMKHSLFGKYKLYGPIHFVYLGVHELFRFLWWQILNNSFSQCGEDLIIERLLNSKKNGFYVDVGAYDPERFSNTKRFYLKGWKGVNIEPNPDNIYKFDEVRRRDINLNVGIGVKEKILNFYKMYPSTLSTFSKSKAKEYQEEGFKLDSVSKIRVTSLVKVFKKYGIRKIDFMSVDTEGYDLDVLRSNDWGKFRPKIVIVETVNTPGVEKFMAENSYRKAYSNKLNSIFVD